MFSKALEARRISIAKHAKDRAVQRARLVLYKHELADLDSFLRQDFYRSKIDQKYSLVPFYANKTCSKYGKGSFISNSKLFRFMGVYDEKNDVTYIRTVVYLGNV